MEIGAGQVGDVEALIVATGLEWWRTEADLAGHPRVVVARRGASPYNSPMSCLFCRIVQGEIPASKVYEDDKLIAFDDMQSAGADARARHAARARADDQRLRARTRRNRRTDGSPRGGDRAAITATPHAGIARCSTATRTPDRRYSTCTCTSSAGRTLGWPPG